MSDDNVFKYARGEQCLLVERATDSTGDPVALGFIVGDEAVRKGVIVDRDKVGELFNALGKWLGDIGDGEAIVEMIEPVERMRLFGEIHDERKRQDEQWGGPEHDDTNTVGRWIHLIRDQATRVLVADMTIIDPTAARRRARFVKIAALAVAAIESIDRKGTAQE